MSYIHSDQGLPRLPLDAAHIVDRLLEQPRRVLLYGAMGVGKSTLLTQLADVLAHTGASYVCVNADPGSPAFGMPGAVSLARRHRDGWQVSASAPLCTLDAGRFRLPLITALRDLLQSLPDTTLLIDAPGVVRGVAGRELLQGLVQALQVDRVLALSAAGQAPPLPDELQSLSVPVFQIRASADARRPGKPARAHRRTALWDAGLAAGVEQVYRLDGLNLLGTPPPVHAPAGWIGRQVALLRAQRTLAMGEVRHFDGQCLTLSLTHRVRDADSLLIRDAQRDTNGLLVTAKPYVTESIDYVPPADTLPSMASNDGPRIVGRVGGVDLALVNGVFGDPLLHMRLRHLRRSLLFDLGEGSRLPARIAHQVTDVFITHAHMDHIGGFLWLLRSRIGDYPACRLYGPPGLAQHIAGFINGVLWDRIGNRGPAFEVMEFHGDHLQGFRLQAGVSNTHRLEDRAVRQGILADEPGYRVRGVLLDHQGTQVVAYAFEPDKQVNIRKDRLRTRGLQPGAWLNELKQHLLADDHNAVIQLPDGTASRVDELADELVLVLPGKKFVYATDLADSADNRSRLVRLADHAHTFFCESAFSEADADHASRNGHLTTRACGEIGAAARVSRLVPFHFSRRYVDRAEHLYDEIRARCPRVAVPASMSLFESAAHADEWADERADVDPGNGNDSLPVDRE